MALPPPKPTITWASAASATASSFSRLGMSGSGLISANTVTLPWRASWSTRAALKASATTSVRVKPFSRTQRPTVGTVPEPNSMRCGRVSSMGRVRSFMVISGSSCRRECRGRCDIRGRRNAGGRERFGVVDRLDQAEFVGDALAGDVEGGAVVHRSADDRQAEGDVDAAQRIPSAGFRIDGEAQQLDRDVPLVVVHGDHGVELAGVQLHEDGVAGNRANHVEAFGDALLDHRCADVDVLAAEQPAFTG